MFNYRRPLLIQTLLHSSFYIRSVETAIMSKTYLKQIIITIEGDGERVTLTGVSTLSTTTQAEGSQMPRESGSNSTGMNE